MNTQIQLRGKQLDGTDYNYVYGDGNPIQNANELRAAVDKATADYGITGRRQTVLVGPGTYDMDFNPLQVTRSVTIEGLSDGRDSVKIKSCTAPNQPGLIVDEPNFSFNNVFNSSYKALALQGFSFNSIFSADNQYLYARSSTQLAKLSTVDGSYITAPIPTGFANGTIYVDKLSGDAFYYAYYYPAGQGAIAKLNSSLGVDNTFATLLLNNQPQQILKDITTGGYFICGDFTIIDGFSRERIAKLNSDGTLDLTFNVGTGINSTAQSMVHLVPTNQLIVGGFFDNYNGNSVNYVAVLDGTTAAYSGLAGQTSPFNSPIQSIYDDQINGQLIFSGYFSSYNGVSLNKAVKTDYTGGNATQLFLSPISYQARMYSTYVIHENYVYVVGSGGNYDGTPYTNGHILKIDLSNGSLFGVLSITPTYLGYSGENLFPFVSSGTLYLMIPYYIQTSSFVAINVNTPIFFEEVYLSNMLIDGILVNDTRLYCSNVYSSTYMDIDYYDNSMFQNGNYGLTLRNNSEFQNIFITGGQLFLNSSRVNSVSHNAYLQNQAFLQIATSNGSFMGSTLNNSLRLYLDIDLRDSEINSCFNNFCSTPWIQSNNKANNIGQVRVERCKIGSSFSNTVVSSLYIEDSKSEYSFLLEGGASGYETNFYLNWQVSNCYGRYSFIFDTGKNNTSFYDNLGQINISNCQFEQRAFYFKTVVNNLSSPFRFKDITVTDLQGSSIGVEVKTIDASWNSAYNWYYGPSFVNCSVIDSNLYIQGNTNVISVIIDESLTTPSNQSDLRIQNSFFNNCHIRSNGGLNHTLNIAVFTNQRGITLSNINYTDCSVSARNGSYGSFIRSLYSTTFINVNNVQFDNCSVRGANDPNPGFLSYVESSGGYDVNFSSINFSNCYSSSANSFITNVTCANFLIDSTNFDDCTSGDYSFISNVSSSQWTQSGVVNFNDCEAGDWSFVAGGNYGVYVPYTPTFNYKHCSAKQYSFLRTMTGAYVLVNFTLCSATGYSFGISYYDFTLGPAISMSGYMDNCVTGDYAFSTDWGTTACANPMYINNCSTKGSIMNLVAYSGSYNS